MSPVRSAVEIRSLSSRNPYLLGVVLATGALSVVSVWLLLTPLAPLLWALALAGFFAVGLAPLVRVLARRMPRSAAIAAVTAAVLLVLTGIVLMIVPAVVAQTSQLLGQVDDLAASGSLDTIAAQLQQFVPVALLDVRALLDDMLTGLAAGTTFQSVSNGVLGAGMAIGQVFFFVTVVFVMTVYLLISGRWLGAQALIVAPHRRRALTLRVGRRVGRSVSRYFLGQLFLAFLNGVLSLAVLLATGSALPLLFAAVALVTALIPLIGIPLGGAIIVLSQALIAPTAPIPWIILAGWFLVYMVVEAYVIAPRVVGRAAELREIVVLFATLVGGALYGIVGALLSVPLAVAAAATIREIRGSRRVAAHGRRR